MTAEAPFNIAEVVSTWEKGEVGVLEFTCILGFECILGWERGIRVRR